jgi:predicted dehydrogenase
VDVWERTFSWLSVLGRRQLKQIVWGLAMYSFTNRWQDGFLDYHLDRGQVRIEVRLWQVLAPVDNRYIKIKKNLRVLVNYLLEVGCLEAFRKVVSRLHENKYRNSSFISCGLGIVSESNCEKDLPAGTRVVFLAPCHPQCCERICLDESLVRPLKETSYDLFSRAEIRYYSLEQKKSFPNEWRQFFGWSEYSGEDVSRDRLNNLLMECAAVLCNRERSPDRIFKVVASKVRDVYHADSSERAYDSRQRTAVVFGYGQYAKTVILPSVGRAFRILKIHEIDPMQLGPVSGYDCGLDTCPRMRVDEKADVFFIAGFHHTHAEIAMEALRQGAWAVVEKPVVTTRTQFEQLRALLEKTGNRLIACFQKRYHPFNAYLHKDLQLDSRAPVSCSCIVFEIPLPERHWYTWPVSGTRVLSNGCHWIDHFLFLNHYEKPTSIKVETTVLGDYIVLIELENRACFSMILTDRGSPRIGLQEFVRFSCKGRSAVIQNGGKYFSEDERKVLRRSRINKLRPYRLMYDDICRRVVAASEGDSLLSFVVSTETIISVEEKLRGNGVASLDQRVELKSAC